MKRLLTAVVLLAALLSAAPALAATEIDRIIAVVGERVITLSELQQEMAPALNELTQRLTGDELATAEDRLKRNTLNSLIDKHLQLEEAKLENIEADDSEVNSAIDDVMKKNHLDEAGLEQALEKEGFTLTDYKQSLKDQLTIIKLVTRAVKSRVTVKDDEVKEYYEKNKAKYSSSGSVRIADILFPAKDGDMDKAKEAADAARKEIMAGTPFEEMAAKCTGDPNASKTCVLGSFEKGELSPEIEDAAFKLSAGEVSEPIKIENGYRLIKVMEKTDDKQKTLEEARPEIVQELTQKQGEQLFAEWVQELRNKTYVEIRAF